jgi:transcriptional regulator with XRE-family HTH domain
LKFPNLNWALAQWGPRYRFAAKLGESESWLSRKMNGRIPFSSQEREVIAKTLGYPTEWLFQEPQPPPANVVHTSIGTGSGGSGCMIFS